MTPRSHHGRTDIPAGAQRHRLLLLGIMAAAGWQPYRFEWWHYQLPEANRYPPLGDSVLNQPLIAAGQDETSFMIGRDRIVD